MSERRNYYRILHAQPDAPMAVIRANYRTLMQKLKLHPDLGGPEWSASLLNVAYATLRDPLRRSAYDQDLLAAYDIRSLGGGSMTNSAGMHKQSAEPGNGNRRNYYRILELQPDAPAVLVRASYQALRKETGVDQALVAEAFAVLSDPASRQRYDDELATDARDSEVTGTPMLTAKQADAATASATGLPGKANAYRAAIMQYCAFCKTPFTRTADPYQDIPCAECGSPLSQPAADFLQESRRALGRAASSGPLQLFQYWPEEPSTAILQDWSPTGLRFTTDATIALDDILKIDGEHFNAVAQVAHGRSEPGNDSIGARFMTVAFHAQRGNFFSAKA